MVRINENCRGCKICLKACMFKAIRIENGKAVIDENKCVLCYNCLKNTCPFDAIQE
ncbi:(4Fe-4S)-binding protein [Fervidicella metallireducens AeB]|uniref:(4Fe-4S)-binding protein n=1 Tax=Fervidicella metallireducens AeB TaxID=1403537 RepID=A0A017RZL9_9CLOT|nr:4Fe-4S dicluster domain-containing protein [Fervidicella metallireducens]EYE89385.1 (4Fe-4S)-binding protein [Fervidicella metallireducens AeB]